MAKLFYVSLEDDANKGVNDDDGELLIDKVIQKDKIDPDSPLVSTELKKKRAELKTQIEKAISESQQEVQVADDEDTDQGSQQTGDDSESEDESDDGQVPQQTGQQTGDGAEPSDEGNPDGAVPDDDEKEDKDKKDDKKSEDPKPKDEKKGEQSTESFFKTNRLSNVSFVKARAGVASFMKNYSSQLQGVKRKTFSFEELPITYTKEQVIEFLSKVSKILDTTIVESGEVSKNHEKSLLDLNEKVTLLVADIEADKRKYSDGASVSIDTLLPMAIEPDGTVDCNAATDAVLEANAYFGSISSKSVGKDLNTLAETMLSNNFVKTDSNNEYKYKQMLPGLSEMCFSLVPYKSYMSDDLDELEFFIVKNNNSSNKKGIYENNIEQKEAAIHQLNSVLECLTKAAGTLDSLRKVVTALNDELSNLKVTVQDIQSGTASEIKSEKIDQLVKGIMLNRLLASFAIGLNNINISYATGSLYYVSARYVS